MFIEQFKSWAATFDYALKTKLVPLDNKEANIYYFCLSYFEIS